MSNIGLSTNTFRLTSKYLDLLNDFIVKANLHAEGMDAKKEQIVDFLSRVNDAKSFDPQFQLLSSIFERKLRKMPDQPVKFFDALIKEIQSDEPARAIPKIELLVRALDSENSEALAKIKGE